MSDGTPYDFLEDPHDAQLEASDTMRMENSPEKGPVQLLKDAAGRIISWRKD